MSKPVERVEIITDRERRRRYTAEEKVGLVEETARPSLARVISALRDPRRRRRRSPRFIEEVYSLKWQHSPRGYLSPVQFDDRQTPAPC